MKTLKEGDFQNKTVLVRCDFNVGINQQDQITDDFRIRQNLPTIEYLLGQNSRVVLLSHLEKNGKLLSLKIIKNQLEKLLNMPIAFANDCVGNAAIKGIKAINPGQAILLENLRFHNGEKNNDDKFAQSLSKLGQIYVNDAFACSHRKHASIVGLPAYLPSYAGLLLESEITNLSKILQNPDHPFAVIIGGAKISTKAKTIANILKIADHLMMGSKIGEALLAQKHLLANKHVLEYDESLEKIDLTNPKIHLPVDGILALADLSEGYLRQAAIGGIRNEEEIYDIGPETIKFYKEIIKDAKTIFFNGPLGLIENPEFITGTRQILDAISKNHQAFKVAGGGETLEIINRLNLQKSFNFLSTGGGAMLEFLAGNVLPGISALN